MDRVKLLEQLRRLDAQLKGLSAQAKEVDTDLKERGATKQQIKLAADSHATRIKAIKAEIKIIAKQLKKK